MIKIPVFQAHNYKFLISTMSKQISIRNLQILTGLDSLSFGLMYCSTSDQIHKLGGDEITMGILAVGTLIGDLLSPVITETFTHSNGKKFGLFLILTTSLLTHIMLAITNSYWFCIVMRVLFSALNQVQNLCLALLLDKENNVYALEKMHTNYSILSGSGYILGPIISGYLFDNEKGFRYIGLLAACLTLINVGLLTAVGEDSERNSKGNSDEECVFVNVSVLGKVSETVSENIKNLKHCKLENHWDVLLVKYLFVSSMFVFCCKFKDIFEHNYGEISSVIMGYSRAYISALVFACTYYATEAKAFADKYPLTFISEFAFFLITWLVFLACYSPTLEFFVLLLIPIIFLKAVITTTWTELFSERRNPHLANLNETATITAGLITPLLFGITHKHLEHNAVILFSCVPLLLCWVIIRWHSRFVKIESPSMSNHCACRRKR